MDDEQSIKILTELEFPNIARELMEGYINSEQIMNRISNSMADELFTLFKVDKKLIIWEVE